MPSTIVILDIDLAELNSIEIINKITSKIPTTYDFADMALYLSK